MPSGDDDRRADLRDGVEVVGELLWQVNATMRVGIARKIADMQSDALPGQPLHVGHRLVILGRGVGLGLLQNREDAGRRAVTRLARRGGRNADQDAVAVDERELLRDRDDDGDRPFGRPLGVPGELPRLKRLEVIASRVLGDRARDRNRLTGAEAEPQAQQSDDRAPGEPDTFSKRHGSLSLAGLSSCDDPISTRGKSTGAARLPSA